MKNFIFVGSFFLSLLFLMGGLVQFFRKKKQQSFRLLLTSIALFLVAGLTAPTVLMTFEQVNYQVKENQAIIIKGTVVPQATVTVDGHQLAVNAKGKFIYQVRTSKQPETKLHFKAKLNHRSEERVITLKGVQKK